MTTQTLDMFRFNVSYRAFDADLDHLFDEVYEVYALTEADAMIAAEAYLIERFGRSQIDRLGPAERAR